MKLKDFLSSINYDKKPLLDKDEKDSRLYPCYVVNRCLSYFVDTIFHSNEMNCCPWLDNKAQFDFYRFGVRKKKRYSEWVKKEEENDVDIVRLAYGYSEQKAREVLNILRPEDLAKIKDYLYKGGTE